MNECGEDLLNILISSSSSDSEDEVIGELLCYHENMDEGAPLPKVKKFVENVIEQYSDAEFQKNLRVSKGTFQHLVSIFEDSEDYKLCISHGGTPAKSAKLHIAAFLWFAGNKTVLRVVATLFDTSISTMFCIIERVTKFILGLGPRILKFPATQDDKEFISNEFFEISGFPNVIGCIDGTYIHIRTPAHKIKSTYVNRHDSTALTLQAICDSKRKFLDVFTGVSGKVHDARVYELSFIKEKINHLEERYHILGDAAYPISPNLLTPYRSYAEFTPQQEEYNKRFSRTRVKIENTFGLLKTRFRQLKELDFWKVEKAAEFIVACCILHNLCIEHEDFLENIQEDVLEELQIPMEPPVYNERGRLLKRLGEMKRDQLAHDFIN